MAPQKFRHQSKQSCSCLIDFLVSNAGMPKSTYCRCFRHQMLLPHVKITRHACNSIIIAAGMRTVELLALSLPPLFMWVLFIWMGQLTRLCSLKISPSVIWSSACGEAGWPEDTSVGTQYMMWCHLLWRTLLCRSSSTSIIYICFLGLFHVRIQYMMWRLLLWRLREVNDATMYCVIWYGTTYHTLNTLSLWQEWRQSWCGDEVLYKPNHLLCCRLHLLFVVAAESTLFTMIVK